MGESGTWSDDSTLGPGVPSVSEVRNTYHGDGKTSTWSNWAPENVDSGNELPPPPGQQPLPQRSGVAAPVPAGPKTYSYLDILNRPQTGMAAPALDPSSAGTRLGAIMAGEEAKLYGQQRQPTPVAAQGARVVMTASGPQIEGAFPSLTNYLNSQLGREGREYNTALAAGSLDRRAELQADEAIVGLEGAVTADRPEIAPEGFGGRVGGSAEVNVAGEGVHSSDQYSEVDPSGKAAPDVVPPLETKPGASIIEQENITVPISGQESYGFAPGNPQQIAQAGAGLFGSRIDAPRDPRVAGWGNIMQA